MASRGADRDWDHFAPLYDEHHQLLYRVALLLCTGDVAAAEDAVVNTFGRVYRSWREHEIDHFLACARHTLVTVAVGQLRRQHATASHAVVPAEPGLEPRVDATSVFALLARIPPRQRTAVVLRLYEDLSDEEIAAALDVSIGTATAQVDVGLAGVRGDRAGRQVSGRQEAAFAAEVRAGMVDAVTGAIPSPELRDAVRAAVPRRAPSAVLAAALRALRAAGASLSATARGRGGGARRGRTARPRPDADSPRG